jgi:hypothetical protein
MVDEVVAVQIYKSLEEETEDFNNALNMLNNYFKIQKYTMIHAE